MDENNKTLEITEQDVKYALEFAKSLASTYPQVFTPMMTNQRMQDVTLNPVIATAANIETALQNPKNNEDNLIGYSENLELSDMLYRRLVLYLSNMLSFDLDWVCTNAVERDYSSNLYNRDYNEVVSFLDRFDVKREFVKVMRQMIRQESYFGQLRTDFDDKYTLQELPEKYCLITGRFPYGMLFDFNMNWFLNAGISLDMYSPQFKEFYNKAFSGGTSKYNPAAIWDDRSGTWAYYVQTNPKDGFWSFKLFDELASRIPFLAPMFPDIVLKAVYRELSKNASIQAATKIILGEIPYNEETKASVRDSFKISAENLARFLYLMRQGINESVSIGAAPLQNMESYEFDMPDRNIYGEYTQVTAASSGVNSRLIYGYDKQNMEETRNSISVDEYMITPVYGMFENFLNYFVNKRTKRYKFKFLLSGTEFDTAKRKKKDDAMELANLGVFIPGKFASALGVQKQDLERLLTEAKANKWQDKLIQITPAFNATKEGTAGAGRPKKSESELGDSGSQTREDGGNMEKGGNV